MFLPPLPLHLKKLMRGRVDAQPKQSVFSVAIGLKSGGRQRKAFCPVGELRHERSHSFERVFGRVGCFSDRLVVNGKNRFESVRFESKKCVAEKVTAHGLSNVLAVVNDHRAV